MEVALRQAAGQGLRLEGIAWIATQQKLQALVRTDPKGFVHVDPGDPWWAVIPRSEWPHGLAEEIKPLWHETHGDRQSELTLHLSAGGPLPLAQREAWLSSLQGCLATEAEEAAELVDPYAEAWRELLQETAEAERSAKIGDDVRRAFARVIAPTRSSTSGAAFSFGGRPATRVCEPCEPDL
uniref:Uncharacterized protein n=1 Tax=Coccolithus braarudii TaxID=221442 RepID=A0A7S0LQQ3_9EUKA